MTTLKRSLITDVVALSVLAVICAMVFASFEVFERFYQFSRGHENWQLDELSGALLAIAIGLPALVMRGYHRQKVAVSEAVHAASRIDSLTGMQNLLGLHGALDERTRGSHSPVPYLLVIDLDRFKSINDLHGHASGDVILRSVASRLNDLSGPDALAFRTGGDEFAMVLDGRVDPDAAAAFAARIVDVVAQPHGIHDRTEALTCSIGIAAIVPDLHPNEIVHRAHQAMYHAKSNTSGQWAVFDEALGFALHGRAMLEAELREAILNNAIVPFFQPILKIETGELTGFEVLARWQRPDGGFVPPDVFIGMAEDLGQIDRLSDQLLRKCCAAMQSWDPGLSLSFNLSPRQLNQPSLSGRIEDILSTYQISGHRMAIEITETAVFIDIDRARTVISHLRSLGVRVSLDDFGIGTSSLAVLSQLPFDTIKIDRSFISNISDNPQNAKIVRGVLALARSLELTVTAEGIESDQDLDFLKQNNCVLGQGYFFSRPVPEDALPQLIEDVTRAAELAAGHIAALPAPLALVPGDPQQPKRRASS